MAEGSNPARSMHFHHIPRFMTLEFGRKMNLSKFSKRSQYPSYFLIRICHSAIGVRSVLVTDSMLVCSLIWGHLVLVSELFSPYYYRSVRYLSRAENTYT
jgi:hypothetical protein